MESNLIEELVGEPRVPAERWEKFRYTASESAPSSACIAYKERDPLDRKDRCDYGGMPLAYLLAPSIASMASSVRLESVAAAFATRSWSCSLVDMTVRTRAFIPGMCLSDARVSVGWQWAS